MLYLELKKIFKRITIWGILGFVVATTLLTMVLTQIFFNKPPAIVDNTIAYQDLVNKIKTWESSESTDRETALIALNNFHEKYKILNASTYEGNLQATFTGAQIAFSQIDFRTINTDYWLVRENDIETLVREQDVMAEFFAKMTISREDFAKINQMWETQHITAILDNISVQILSADEVTRLNTIIDTYNKKVSVNYINTAYNVLNNTYKMYIDNNFDGRLHNYVGFKNYSRPEANRTITLNKSVLDNEQYDNNAHAFAFGDIYNGNEKISVLDYVFTNLEMAGIPIILIIIVFMAASFFTDIYTNTVVGVVASRRSRIGIVLCKLTAVIIATVAVLLTMTAIYVLAPILLFGGTFNLAPIVFLSNGMTAITMSGVNYFVLYLLSTLFKLLIIMLTAGLFSLSRSNPKLIAGLSLGVIVAILTSNALLGSLWFYQFIPLLSLHPINYFGAGLFLSSMPAEFNILYTLPVLTLYLVIGYSQLVYNFSKRDFAL